MMHLRIYHNAKIKLYIVSCYRVIIPWSSRIVLPRCQQVYDYCTNHEWDICYPWWWLGIPHIHYKKRYGNIVMVIIISPFKVNILRKCMKKFYQNENLNNAIYLFFMYTCYYNRNVQFTLKHITGFKSNV